VQLTRDLLAIAKFLFTTMLPCCPDCLTSPPFCAFDLTSVCVSVPWSADSDTTYVVFGLATHSSNTSEFTEDTPAVKNSHDRRCTSPKSSASDGAVSVLVSPNSMTKITLTLVDVFFPLTNKNDHISRAYPLVAEDTLSYFNQSTVQWCVSMVGHTLSCICCCSHYGLKFWTQNYTNLSVCPHPAHHALVVFQSCCIGVYGRGLLSSPSSTG